MPVKTFNTRIKNKMDSVSNLTPQSGALVPLAGEIVIGYPSTASNTNSAPFIMKIGDGTHNWGALPAIGPNTFYGTTPSASNPAGADNEVLTVAVPSDKKVYARYVFSNEDDTTFTVALTGGNYMESEHYILLDNSATGYDRLFNGITIAGVDDANIHIQREYVSAYDITELKISIYSISGTLHATVTSKAGITNGGLV